MAASQVDLNETRSESLSSRFTLNESFPFSKLQSLPTAAGRAAPMSAGPHRQGETRKHATGPAWESPSDPQDPAQGVRGVGRPVLGREAPCQLVSEKLDTI